MIADNRLTENAAWDEHLLAEQFEALSEVDLDFSLELTVFETGEIDLMIEALTSANEGTEDPADVLLPTDSVMPVTQVGDLWLLGKHRVPCADSTQPSNFASLMHGEKAALVFSDSPYNVPITGHAVGNGKIQHEEFRMASGEMSQAEFTTFLKQTFWLLATNSVDGSIHYICMDRRHMGEVLSAGRQIYDELKNLCGWGQGQCRDGLFLPQIA